MDLEVPEFNWAEVIKAQLQHSLMATVVDISLSTSSNNSPIYVMPNSSPVAYQTGPSTTTLILRLRQSKVDVLKNGLTPEDLWNYGQSGFISKWLEDCGHVVNMSQSSDLAHVNFEVLLSIMIFNMDKFIANVQKHSWQAYCDQFYIELEETLTK